MCFTFKKKERVTGEKRVETLFSGGQSFVAYPLRVVFLKMEPTVDLPSVSILISVPKKRIKRAIHRNRLKRLIRETYRLNKHLIDIKDYHLDVAFIYVKDEPSDYTSIEKGMQKALNELTHRMLSGAISERGSTLVGERASTLVAERASASLSNHSRTVEAQQIEKQKNQC
jgi:ribonuclease P protein component